MDDAQAQPADWVQELIRDYQDKLTCGLYEAIYNLAPPAVETLMRAQAQTCVGAFLQLGTLRVPMQLEEFLAAMRIGGPSQVEIQREGNIIHWTERHRGECACPFVHREVIRLDPKLCICGAHWVKQLFATVAQTEVDVQMLDTVATGSQSCCFLITVKGPSGQSSRSPGDGGCGHAAG